MKRATRTREGYHWFRGWRKPSAAQRRVLDELVAGGTNAEIARRLGISEDGVKWHLSELRQELDIDDRRQLADWWRTRREHAGLFFPLAVLGRLAGNHAAVFVATVAIATAGVAGLAYSSLTGNDEPTNAGQPASALPTAAPVVVVPTPTATPVPPTAVVFDVDSRSVRTLPGTVMNRRWLDTKAMTFVGYGSNGPVVIDAAGQMKPVPGHDGGEPFPLADSNRVLLWRYAEGILSSVDVNTGTETVLGNFHGEVGPRLDDISTQSRLIALSDAARSEVRIYSFDGSGERLAYRAAPEQGINVVSWSSDGTRLLLLIGPRQSREQVGPPQALVVVDSNGRVLVERAIGTARWSGSSWLLLAPWPQFFPQVNPGAAGTFLNVTTGADVVAHDAGALLCASPDARYAMYVYDRRPTGSQQLDFLHQLRDLASGDLVAEARSSTLLTSCDWTPDSRRVVLSPGGK